MAKKKAAGETPGEKRTKPRKLRAAGDANETAQSAEGTTAERTAGLAGSEQESLGLAGQLVDKRPSNAFPIVGVGASAGGLEALDELFENMPPDPGMAFVVVTHQHPGQKSMLPELLARETAMVVTEATDGTELQPNHVYVGTPGGYVAVLNGVLHRMETGGQAAPKLPIDYFFRSLAHDQGQRAIGVVLSGTGTDGTLGVQEVKAASGMAMVQSPQSAKYAGMPASAVGTGIVDYVLRPAEMPRKLIAYRSNPEVGAGNHAAGDSVEDVPPDVSSEPIQKIIVLLRDRTGHDFSQYKTNTIRRRIERRMNAHQIATPEKYVRYLQENADETDTLFKEMLISVTNFFRDPVSWESLAAGPLPQLLQTRAGDQAFRAWVPGCATGEEVYSLAIVVRECIEKLNLRMDVQIFGTDLDADAVDAARIGRFPQEIEADVTPHRLARYFTHDDEMYCIRKEIREMAVFAPQNLIKDPPFTKLDLLCCRNLLIYLNADLQQRLLPIFHYALKPGGLLMLGASETIGRFGDLFDEVDKKWKIYRRAAGSTNVIPEMPASRVPGTTITKYESSMAMNHQESSVELLLERYALKFLCPTFVVVNQRGDLIHVCGRTGDYLELPDGQVCTNILDMARKGLSHQIATIMRQADQEGAEVVRENVPITTDGKCVTVNLTAKKIDAPEPIRGLLLIAFKKAISPADGGAEPQTRVLSDELSGESQPGGAAARRTQSGDTAELEGLRRELQYMRESHQTTLEELETSNEELKSTNEELQSTNEEMQSTNEELETSKEELQSLNEELTTLNAESQSKIEDLSRANDDMQNLLNSIDIATIFLDEDLNIRRFTDQAARIVTVRASDVGRPIGELASKLTNTDLVRDCRAVLDTLIFRKLEVETVDGSWYLMRILPYRTRDKVIDGLVLTFVNIDDLKAAEKSSGLRRHFQAVFDTVREPLLVLDENFAVVSANRFFYEAFRLQAPQVIGKTLYSISDGKWDIPGLRKLLETILPDNTSFDGYSVEHEFPRIGRRAFLLNARRLEDDSPLPGRILLAMQDVTGQS